MNPKPKHGVFILTRNEERHIEDCLKTCLFFDEIVIVDSGSQDRTVEIAQNYTKRIAKRPFTHFLEQREYAVSLMESEWIFYLDADERIPDALKNTILEFVNQEEYTLLEMPRRNYLLGKWIAHSGWYPDFQARLIQKKTLAFHAQIVHERLSTTGKSFRLDPKGNVYLMHYTCTDLAAYFQKINHYTSLEAVEHVQLSPLKMTPFGILTRSIGMFTQSYIHHKGYKDGFEGFIVAVFQLLSSFLLMMKIWEKRKQKT